MKRWQHERIIRHWRKATTQPCPTCHQPTHTGVDADICAWDATTETTPLTWGGEIAAHLTGRHTYTYYAGELHRRTDLTQPNTRGITVAAHHCHNPTPTTWHQPTTEQTTPTTWPPF